MITYSNTVCFYINITGLAAGSLHEHGQPIGYEYPRIDAGHSTRPFKQGQWFVSRFGVRYVARQYVSGTGIHHHEQSSLQGITTI